MLFFCLCLWFSSHSCLTSVASLTEYAGGWTRACVAHWPMLGLERDLGDLCDPSPASPRLCLKCTPLHLPHLVVLYSTVCPWPGPKGQESSQEHAGEQGGALGDTCGEWSRAHGGGALVPISERG